MQRLATNDCDVTDRPDLWRETDRVYLTPEEAASMLPGDDPIHVVSNPGVGVMIGADWSKRDLAAALATATKIEESGPLARQRGYGLCFMTPDHQRLFIKTH